MSEIKSKLGDFKLQCKNSVHVLLFTYFGLNWDVFLFAFTLWCDCTANFQVGKIS